MQALNQFIINLNIHRDKSIEEIIKTESCVVKKHQLIADCYFDILLQLKSFILEYQFKDVHEEILFFKMIKPQYNSELIYANKIVQLMLKKPPGDKETARAYIKSNLDEITEFFRINQEFYLYYRSNSFIYDHIYFVRQIKSFAYYPDHQLNNFEPGFATTHDYLVSQIIANEKLEHFIKEALEGPSIIQENPHGDHMGKTALSDLHWTDSKSALIELIYALYAKGSINNGDLDIRELTRYFEGLFNVKLPDVYRTFQDIKLRQNPTKYLNSLISSLENKITEGMQ